MIPLLLANGITTVRDMGGYLESLVPLREEIKKGSGSGPRLYLRTLSRRIAALVSALVGGDESGAGERRT
jgi:imidazolonepropionase-like amidohydrolase